MASAPGDGDGDDVGAEHDDGYDGAADGWNHDDDTKLPENPNEADLKFLTEELPDTESPEVLREISDVIDWMEEMNYKYRPSGQYRPGVIERVYTEVRKKSVNGKFVDPSILPEHPSTPPPPPPASAAEATAAAAAATSSDEDDDEDDEDEDEDAAGGQTFGADARGRWATDQYLLQNQAFDPMTGESHGMLSKIHAIGDLIVKSDNKLLPRQTEPDGEINYDKYITALEYVSEGFLRNQLDVTVNGVAIKVNPMLEGGVPIDEKNTSLDSIDIVMAGEVGGALKRVTVLPFDCPEPVNEAPLSDEERRLKNEEWYNHVMSLSKLGKIYDTPMESPDEGADVDYDAVDDEDDDDPSAATRTVALNAIRAEQFKRDHGDQKRAMRWRVTRVDGEPRYNFIGVGTPDVQWVLDPGERRVLAGEVNQRIGFIDDQFYDHAVAVVRTLEGELKASGPDISPSLAERIEGAVEQINLRLSAVGASAAAAAAASAAASATEDPRIGVLRAFVSTHKARGKVRGAPDGGDGNAAKHPRRT